MRSHRDLYLEGRQLITVRNILERKRQALGLKRTEQKSRRILFNGCVIFHGVYIPQLPYPFVC